MPPSKTLERESPNEVWEAAVAIATLCIQHGMTGMVDTLGKLPTRLVK